MLDKNEIQILVANITNLAELNVFQNIQVFLNEALPKVQDNPQLIIPLLKGWIDQTVDSLKTRLELK